MVKTCDMEIAEEYGIEKFPSIVYFENGIPYLYPGTLKIFFSKVWVEKKIHSQVCIFPDQTIFKKNDNRFKRYFVINRWKSIG